MSSRRILVAALSVAVLATAALVAWYARHTGGEPRAAASERPATGEAAATAPPISGAPGPVQTGSARAPGAGSGSGGHAVGPSHHGIGFEAPGTLAKIPDRYELSMVGGHAFINLAGGASQMYPGPSRLPAPPTHAVHGRVVDARGNPVAGAAVVFSDRMVVMGGHLSGYTGATSDANGEITADNVPDNDAMLALAIHPLGWSQLADATTSPLVLVLCGHGALHGRATYNGHGESFNLRIRTRPESKLELYYQTDPDGRYVIASLPPGTYTVGFTLAQDIAGGVSKATEREVTITDRGDAQLDVAQSSATVVVVIPDLPASTAPEIVEYWLFTGSAAPATVADARTRGKAEHAPYILFGGHDAPTPNQFHDISAGTYTACIAADRTALFGCASLTVLDGDDVRELHVKLVPPPASK